MRNLGRIALLLAVCSTALAHDNGGRGSYRFIEGAWKTTLTFTDCRTGFRVGGPAEGFITLAADGSVVETGPALNENGYAIASTRSEGHGRWERENRATFKILWGYRLYDERGISIAEVPHYGTITVTADSKSFVAYGRHQYTPFQEGQTVGGTCWKVEGTRLDF
jgi:hypothetical protein